MTDLEMSVLRAQAEGGDSDATDQLIESAAEHGDLATLERLAQQATRPTTSLPSACTRRDRLTRGRAGRAH